MPAIQPAEHPAPDPVCAGSMFIVVVVVVLWGFESVSIPVVVGDNVVDAGSEKENDECVISITYHFDALSEGIKVISAYI